MLAYPEIQHYPIASRIEDHRRAVIADEASFTADGVAIDEGAARRTGEDEANTFVDLKLAECASHDEVQAKLGYFLDGTIGERGSLIQYLFEESHGADPEDGLDPLENFLRSMLIAVSA